MSDPYNNEKRLKKQLDLESIHIEQDNEVVTNSRKNKNKKRRDTEGNRSI